MITEIPDEFLDVDFREESSKANRLMGMVEPQEFEQASFRSYGATHRVYPPSEWAELIRYNDRQKAWATSCIKFPHDQNGEPSCVYNMAALGLQIIIRKAFGLSIKFSAISGYRWNGTRRSGSSVPGSGRWLEAKGLIPSKIAANAWLRDRHGMYLHPDNGYGIAFPENWMETSINFLSGEWFYISTVEEWISALIDGWVCGGGRDGHAVLHTECGINSSDVISSIYCNSWGPWGFILATLAGDLRSFGADSLRKVETMVRRGGYCLKLPRTPNFVTAA